jgi:type IV pilus assembly protein PilA
VRAGLHPDRASGCDPHIGILAAIALPAFLGQRARAQDTSAKTAVRQAQSAMETWYTDNQTYVATAAQLQDIESSLNVSAATKPDYLTVTGTSVDGYTLTAKSKTGNTFTIAKDATGQSTRSCSSAGGTSKGGCPATNSW